MKKIILFMLIFFSIATNSQTYIIAKKPKKEEEKKEVLNIYNKYKDIDTLYIKDKYLQSLFLKNNQHSTNKYQTYSIAGVPYYYRNDTLIFNEFKCIDIKGKKEFYKKNRGKIVKNKTLKTIETSLFLIKNIFNGNKNVFLICENNLFKNNLKLFSLKINGIICYDDKLIPPLK